VEESTAVSQEPLINRRTLRGLLLLLSALLGAGVGYAADGPGQALLLGASFPALILGTAWLRGYLDRRSQRARVLGEKQARLALLDAVCRNEARCVIRDHYEVAERYARQYDPDRAQRELMERVTRLYRVKDNQGAEAVLREAHGTFPGSPYVAARHARMLLQDLRIEEAREVISRALDQHPDEISLLILRDGMARADRADGPPEVTAEIQRALAEMVEWAGMQLELIVGRTSAQLRADLDVVVH